MAEIHTPTQEHQDEMMDEAIAQAFVVARRRLGPEHHSRLSKAWELVVERAVIDNADGSHTVKGVGQPEYLVDPSGCTCTDCPSGKAPLGLCKHVLAVALQKRSIEKFQDMGAAHGQLAADVNDKVVPYTTNRPRYPTTCVVPVIAILSTQMPLSPCRDKYKLRQSY